MITINYNEIKERLLKSYRNGELKKFSSFQFKKKSNYERLEEFSKTILNSKADRIRLDDFRKVLRSLMNDFAPDTLENKNLRLFDIKDNDEATKEIQEFLSNAYTDIRKKRIHNVKDYEQLNYNKRTGEEERAEKENYVNFINHSSNSEDYENLEPEKENENDYDSKTLQEEQEKAENQESQKEMEKEQDSETTQEEQEKAKNQESQKETEKEQDSESSQKKLEEKAENQESQKEMKKEQDSETTQEKQEEKDLKSNKNYLKALKKIAPFVAGAAVGLGASVIVPSITLTGLGHIRIAYSLIKTGNKIISKAFLKGKPTKLDKWIDARKASVEEKFGDTKIYAAVQKVNEVLKKREVQLFINGVAVGYSAGRMFDLKGKVDKLGQSKFNGSNVTEKITNQPVETVSGNTINNPQNVSKKAINNSFENVHSSMNANGTGANYDWLSTGENIDLSNVEYGFTDSINAMGDTNPVHLLSQYAVGDNGTFIKHFVLPNGETFTGNIGELLAKGIDPKTIAARVMNQNGDYAWLNAQDILDAYNNTAGKIR